jgi:hypothetical protein
LRVLARLKWELRRRFQEVRGPLLLVLLGAVVCAVAYVLRVNVVADVAFFSALIVFFFALDVFLAPPPGEPERGVSFSGAGYMGPGDPRPPD